MRRLIAFSQVTTDGFFAGPDGDLSWAHRPQTDAEWNAFVANNAKNGGGLVFGRVTYQMMASYWPTPLALKTMPEVAESINNLPKVVFSKTLSSTSWQSTTLIKGDLPTEIQKLKEGSGGDMTILGSGSIISQLAEVGLIDEYQLVVNPVILGQGKALFDRLKGKLLLKLTRSRTFANGNVLLCYEPAK